MIKNPQLVYKINRDYLIKNLSKSSPKFIPKSDKSLALIYKK